MFHAELKKPRMLSSNVETGSAVIALSKINAVLGEYGGVGADRIEDAADAVRSTVGGAYDEGVNDTTDVRDAKDAAIVEAFNKSVGDYGKDVTATDAIPAATEKAIETAYKDGESDGYESGFNDGEQKGVADTTSARDTLDASRLSDINAALTENRAEAAESIDDVAEKIPKVREVGFNDGHNAGQAVGYEEGYGHGVTATTAERDAADAELLNAINEACAEVGVIGTSDLSLLPEHIPLVRDMGYNAGYEGGRGEYEARETQYLNDINAALKANFVDEADTLDDVDEKIERVYQEGYDHGEIKGERSGFQSATELYDNRIDAELAEVNDVIQTHGDSKAETLEQISEAVRTTIGAASMKAQTVGYAQGVDDTNAQRDTLDASRLAEINVALTENGGTAADTLDGVDEKIPEVHAAGVKSEYDRLWRLLQSSGLRTNYSYAFGGDTFPKDAFRPKYDIKPVRAQAMFQEYGSYAGTAPYRYDLAQQLEECGVRLDISKCTVFSTMFHYSLFTRLPTMDFAGSNGASLGYAFSYMSQLEQIDKIISYENTNYQNTTFQNDSKLTHIEFEGVIAMGTFNMQWSTKLSRASIESIIAALSATATGKSITLSKTAVNTAFETSAGSADGSTSDAWKTLIGTKTNWTISLV